MFMQISFPSESALRDEVRRLLIHKPAWWIELDQVHTSYTLLALLAVIGILVGILFQTGVLGWILGIVGMTLRGAIRNGFFIWRRLFSWASWLMVLGIVLVLLTVGQLFSLTIPLVTVFCGLFLVFMGVITCLAYMFIDLERYEVARGYKAVHNPLKGQVLAVHLATYGSRVRFQLLVAAAIGAISGFALLNQGLFESFGRNWYRLEMDKGEPGYSDFLAYALIHLLGLINVLNVADSSKFVHLVYVHTKAWPATTLLTGFKTFFTLILLQQIFASVRQGRLLAETIADFWSPHQPIHERARYALPQYGTVAISPLLQSLRTLETLTKEQRERLPEILATIGPAAIPGLKKHLYEAHEPVRAIVVATLGRLQALPTVALLAQLVDDESDLVRQSLAEAMGDIGMAGARPTRLIRPRAPRPQSFSERLHWLQRWRRRRELAPPRDPMVVILDTLRKALNDKTTAVRIQAAQAVGKIGQPARGLMPDLIQLLRDTDETARCQAAESLGRLDGATKVSVPALTELLEDASSAVKVSAARALGSLKQEASVAVPKLVPLLQDRDEAVRTAAAEAISQVGHLNGEATESLVVGLASEDNLVRAQAAEALGTIGTTAQEAAPALVEAMDTDNEHVRAKAVEALGKIGEAAADVAVPSLVHVLHGSDSWVSALAAEALGQMGESADQAIPALVRSLSHTNALVRSNAAKALAKMGESAEEARTALETAAADDDGGVRSQAIRALGLIGKPTPGTERIVSAGLTDEDPLVRAAAVEAVGEWDESSATLVGHLMPLLEDANDQVKVQTVQVLPRLGGSTPEIIQGLCLRLQQDDSALVQEQTAAALGRMGASAKEAGPTLLRIIQTGEASVRLEAIRAVALIHPDETLAALAIGIKDSESAIRKVASAGWMLSDVIPDEVVPSLIEALRDPDVQVRANAAHALARLETMPVEAIPSLIDCSSDPSDGLRINAAMALKIAPADKTVEVMHQLLDDSNLRVRLIAASCILPTEPDNAKGAAILAEALNDSAPRVRTAAEELAKELEPAQVEEAVQGEEVKEKAV
jgi:HEAT repeat protein